LQFDLITEGDTKAEAEEMVVDAIFEQVTYAIEHDLMDYLFQPAAPEDWRRLLVTVQAPKKERFRCRRYPGG
jgi:hypothetical protein